MKKLDNLMSRKTGTLSLHFFLPYTNGKPKIQIQPKWGVIQIIKLHRFVEYDIKNRRKNSLTSNTSEMNASWRWLTRRTLQVLPIVAPRTSTTCLNIYFVCHASQGVKLSDSVANVSGSSMCQPTHGTLILLQIRNWAILQRIEYTVPKPRA